MSAQILIDTHITYHTEMLDENNKGEVRQVMPNVKKKMFINKGSEHGSSLKEKYVCKFSICISDI